MIHILSQPPNDEFTLRLFFNLLKDLDIRQIKYDAFYAWSMELIQGRKIIQHFNKEDYAYSEEYLDTYSWLNFKFYWNFILENSKEDLIVIGIKDNLNVGNFNPWYNTEPDLVTDLKKVFHKLKNKKIILISSLINLENYITEKNVKVICWGGDITNQHTEYSKNYISSQKNLDSKYSFLFLNRGMRPQRLHTLSYIFYKNLEKFGILTCMFQKELNHDRFNDTEWQFSKEDHDIFKIGQNKLAKHKFEVSDDPIIYTAKTNDNYTNLIKKLKYYYQDTFIEIIPETLFSEQTILITEKTHHCILEMCFPIWISSPGTVHYLRKKGLDVFDDIIDHSYDLIEHPIGRIKAAIDLNINLLNDINLTKSLWTKNKIRLSNNVKFIQTKFYDLITDDAKTKFRSLL